MGKASFPYLEFVSLPAIVDDIELRDMTQRLRFRIPDRLPVLDWSAVGCDDPFVGALPDAPRYRVLTIEACPLSIHFGTASVDQTSRQIDEFHRASFDWVVLEPALHL